jgi:hypothetical protein
MWGLSLPKTQVKLSAMYSLVSLGGGGCPEGVVEYLAM